MTILLAYHSDPKIKKTYLNRVEAHRKADEIIKGTYWENGKGCAVGCTIHSDKHKAYETELGVPQVLARLEDKIFEGASSEYAKTWPERFLKAIKPGADLSKVGWKFQHWLLLDPKEGVIKYARPEDKGLFEKIGGLLWDLALGKRIDRSAAWSAESAAELASAESAESAASARSAESAARSARSAAWSAESAAESAASAASAASAESARSAAWSAESAASARSAESAARSAYEKQGDYLIKLLKAVR